MKKVGIIIFISALVVGVVLANFFSFGNSLRIKSPISVSFGKIKGSGNFITEKRDVSDFQKVSVSGIFKVEIVAQKDFSVEVDADDNLMPLIKTRVSGDTLKIESEKKFSGSKKVLIRVYAPNIEELDLSGVTKTKVTNLDNESFKIDTSGVSKIYVEGKTSELTIDMSGASKIEAKELEAKKVSIDGSGATKAYVKVTEEISADLSGASRVRYLGSPSDVNKKTSGVSKLSQIKE